MEFLIGQCLRFKNNVATHLIQTLSPDIFHLFTFSYLDNYIVRITFPIRIPLTLFMSLDFIGLFFCSGAYVYLTQLCCYA